MSLEDLRDAIRTRSYATDTLKKEAADRRKEKAFAERERIKGFHKDLGDFIAVARKADKNAMFRIGGSGRVESMDPELKNFFEISRRRILL